MSEDTQVEQKESNDSIEPSKEDTITDLRSQVSAMQAKMNELLGEAKVAKQKAREEREAKEQAKLEKARKEGDYEQLLKSSEKERASLSDQLNKMHHQFSSEKIQKESLRLAAEMADGANAELLSEFISRRLKYTDDGLKVLDRNGELTVSSIDDLKAEFQKSEKYKSLLRGIKSSGGNAKGNRQTEMNAKSNVMTRSEFEAMDVQSRMDHCKSGGIVVDD